MGAPQKPRLVLSLTTADDDLARLYPWLDEAAKDDGLAPKLLQQMHVALDEAVSNVVLHAFEPGDEARLSVEYVSGEESVALVVADSGRPFDPIMMQSPAPALSLETAEAGGKGLILLRHFCKDIFYRWAEGQNQLTLRFARGEELGQRG